MPCRVLPLLVFFAVLLPACGSGGGPRSTGTGATAGGGGPGAVALLPVKLSVHPLTRIGADGEGRPALIVHAELLDRFEQTTKALGRFRVALYQPGGRGGSEAEGPLSDGSFQTQDLIWDVDATDPDLNARLFDDLVTRTYTLSLVGLPDWAVAWARDGAAGPAGAPTVQVEFGYEDPAGGGGLRTLTDRHRLMR